jgi:hypothetical protein
MAQWVVLVHHHTFSEPKIWSTPFGNKTDATSYRDRISDVLNEHYDFSVERLDKLGKVYQSGFYFENQKPEETELILELIRKEEL